MSAGSDSRLRFGKGGRGVGELSDDELWTEVRKRRRARGRGDQEEIRENVQEKRSVASALGSRTKQSVAQWYANLELEPGAPLGKVREAYERLSHQFRPEQHAGDPDRHSAAQELTKSLNHAYESLSAYLKKD